MGTPLSGCPIGCAETSKPPLAHGSVTVCTINLPPAYPRHTPHCSLPHGKDSWVASRVSDLGIAPHRFLVNKDSVFFYRRSTLSQSAQLLVQSEKLCNPSTRHHSGVSLSLIAYHHSRATSHLNGNHPAISFSTAPPFRSPFGIQPKGSTLLPAIAQQSLGRGISPAHRLHPCKPDSHHRRPTSADCFSGIQFT
jgi:hypothetical protein